MRIATAREERLAREAREDLNERIAKALAHPLRVRIMGFLSERDASASHIAREINEDGSLVAYHCRVLHDYGLVKVIEVIPTRGGPKLLRATTESLFSDEAWSSLNFQVRAGISRETVENLGRKMNDAFSAGTFDSKVTRHLSHQTVPLDPTGWDEVNALMAFVMTRVKHIAGRVVERSGEDELFPATVGLLSFESPKMYESPPRIP
jgi:DNA-binding transcriptional ArsR family regulator